MWEGGGWPELALPSQRPQGQSSEPSTSAAPAPFPAIPEQLRASKEVVDRMLAAHHAQVDALKALGVDPCLEYKKKQAPEILGTLFVQCVERSAPTPKS